MTYKVGEEFEVDAWFLTIELEKVGQQRVTLRMGADERADILESHWVDLPDCVLTHIVLDIPGYGPVPVEFAPIQTDEHPVTVRT